MTVRELERDKLSTIKRERRQQQWQQEVVGVELAEPLEISRRSRASQQLFEKAPLAVLLISSIAVAAYRFLIVSGAQTLEWDSAAFLTNAGVYAGFGQFSQAYDPTRPPLVPVIISLGFRILGPSQVFGYAVSAGFYFLVMIGGYLLARQAMINKWLSVMAALSYAVTPTVFEWSGMIVSDVEGVAVGTVALATFIMATNGHKRLYLLSMPLMILAVLTRYSMGIVIPAAIVYLIASKKYDIIFDSFDFYYGVGLSILAIIIVGWQWIAYPFSHHETLAILFPTPDATNPFHSPLGAAFYAYNLPQELGSGFYGFLLLGLLLVAVGILILQRSSEGRKNISNPVAVALAFWLVAMLLYYSVEWPYADLRYSVEFAMPAIILAFWALSMGVSGLGSTRSKNFSRVLGVSLIVFCVLLVATMEVQAANETFTTSPVLEVGINSAMRQAVGWVVLNVPVSEKLESNWYTLMWWYAPQYNTTSAPINYDLTTPSDYSQWITTMLKNHIEYVIYVDPSEISIPSQLTPVFSTSAQNATSIVVYKVQ